MTGDDEQQNNTTVAPPPGHPDPSQFYDHLYNRIRYAFPGWMRRQAELADEPDPAMAVHLVGPRISAVARALQRLDLDHVFRDRTPCLNTDTRNRLLGLLAPAILAPDTEEVVGPEPRDIYEVCQADPNWK